MTGEFRISVSFSSFAKSFHWSCNSHVAELYSLLYLIIAKYLCFATKLLKILLHCYSRLFRKYVFGEADEIELKFVNRSEHSPGTSQLT
jgi:hypothetical protein